MPYFFSWTVIGTVEIQGGEHEFSVRLFQGLVTGVVTQFDLKCPVAAVASQPRG